MQLNGRYQGCRGGLEPVLEAYIRLEKVLADQAYKGGLGEILGQVYHGVLEVTKKIRRELCSYTLSVGSRTNPVLVR